MRSSLSNLSVEAAPIDSKHHRFVGDERFLCTETEHPRRKSSQIKNSQSLVRDFVTPLKRIPGVDDVAVEIETAMENSGYPIRNIRCKCVGDTLILMGRTTRYFHVQVALTLALSLADRRRVVSKIEVRPHVSAEPQ